jgi:cytochrome c556
MPRAIFPRMAATLLIATASLSALTAESLSPAAAVDTRQAGFKKMGAALKALNDQMKAATADAAVLARAAAAIAAGADALEDWFPAGSGAESGDETDALPNIWTERPRFDGLAVKLVAESKRLEEVVAAGDLAAIGSQVKTVGTACSACHRSFRAD